MNQKNKAVVMLTYSEILYSSIQTPYKKEAREALDICWQWIETENVSGEDIYSHLDDGTDFGGIYILMQMDEKDENIIIWDDLSYALSYTDYLAYQKDGQMAVPAPIENVDDSIYDLFISNLENIDTKLVQHLELILNFVTSQNPSKQATIEFLENNDLI